MNSHIFVLGILGEKLLEGLFTITCALFKSVARMYDLILNIATNRIDFTQTISSLTGTIYILIGIFMLFRIMVSFLNMLVDPDKINDKSAGAGAVITRVVVAIILLIVLKPDSFAFNFLNKAEEALLEPTDGLITNFISSINYNIETSEGSNTTGNTNNTTSNSNEDLGSLTFAREIFKIFITSEEEDVEEITEGLLVNSDGNKEVFKAYKKEKIDIDLFFALIIALAIVIYFVFVCVDIVIRSLKLMILQIIAPIAVISYIDPKDKIFNNWGKMYLSTYADIFIKLFSIGIIINLIKVVLSANTEGYTLIYIIGLLVFIKGIPTLINKIFGLDVAAGSFKDAFNVAKKGIGFGAGALVGGTVGAATGKGFGGRVSGFVRGAFQGAGSGYKGDIYGGARNVASKNFRINDAKANGLGFFGRSAAEVAGNIGLSPKTRLDNKIKEKVDNQKMLDDWRKQKDNVEAMAEKNNVISDLNTKLANGEIGKSDYKKIREEYIKWMTAKDENGNYIAKEKTSFKYSGTYKNLATGRDETLGAIEYKAGDAGKIRQAMSVLQTTYDKNTSLRKELRVKDQNGHLVEAKMDTYQDYLDSEDRATQLRNAYETQITSVQQSDEYRRAAAFDEYSKKS